MIHLILRLQQDMFNSRDCSIGSILADYQRCRCWFKLRRKNCFNRKIFIQILSEAPQGNAEAQFWLSSYSQHPEHLNK